MANWYLVAYDIRHPKRLRRVHNKLVAHGYALQKSIFLCHGTPSEIKQFYIQLSQELITSEDDLRFIPLSAQWYLHFWGSAPLCPELHNMQWPAHQILDKGQWAGKVKKVKTHFTYPPTPLSIAS